MEKGRGEMTNRELIYLCAFRYAIGRRTYIVGIVCEQLKKARLSKLAKKQIINEINEVEKNGLEYLDPL